MEPSDKIGERFEKWDASNWLSVEREVNAFQKKVADTMIKLGSFEFVPDLNPCLEDESVLGDQLYLEIVRPRLYKLGYVPKEKKAGEEKKKAEDDSEDEDQEEEPKEEPKKGKEVKETKPDPKDKKKAKKQKTKKAPPPKKEDLMKQKIVRQNFAKEIQVVFSTFSPQKMQIDYGFRQKKLQLKISTFFYIAYFIRKNKIKMQIDESQIYQLINILIKVYRIFNQYQGKSFLDSSAQIPISQRCMSDLKQCLDSLRQYYNYNIKSVITKYPKLVYYTTYDKYFPTLDIKPYTSQIEFINIIKDALKKDRPTMVFYKTMIGSGKTTTSISIANLVSQLKLLDGEKHKKMQLLYCCVIKSVRTQVGRLAYSQRLKFALGAMDRITGKNNRTEKNIDQRVITAQVEAGRELFPRVVNSFSCGDADYVDLIVTDLYTTKSYLNEPNLTKKIRLRQLGQMDRENLILFIDQPTAFCNEDSKVTRKLFEILAQAPPKIIIFASATMPDKDQLQNTIQLVKMRSPGLQTFEISSREFQIGCQFCTFEGEIIYPHSEVKNRQQLEETISLLRKNPFLMRLYTGPSLFTLLDRCKKAGIKKLPKLQNFLEIRQTDILSQTLGLLEQLKDQEDKVIEQVCSVDKETQNVAVQQKDSQEEEDVFAAPKTGNYVNLKKLLRSDAYKFLGGCLIATADPMQFAKNTFGKWISGIPPIKRLLERYEKDKEILRVKLEQIDESKNIRADEKLIKKSEVQNEFEPKFDFPETKRINTVAHYQKYCKNKSPLYHSKLIRPIIIENVGFQLFSQVEDWMIQLLFCGVALYSKQIDSIVYQNKVDDLAASGFLAYIICDESLCYGTNFPISNVILTDSLAERLTINDMFQLIGRAGRVGQSWTARAFLEEQGAAKLKHYIKDKDKAKYSNQAKVFEKMAVELISNPVLFFKNQKCIVKPHSSNFHPQSQGQQIDVVIKSHHNMIIKRINIVAHRKTAILSSVFEIKDTSIKSSKKTYKFPSTRLYSTDIPIIINGEGYQVYDVEFFNKNSQQFVKSIFTNAIKRTLKEHFTGAQLKAFRNQFSFAGFMRFFQVQSGTYTAIIEVDSPDTLFCQLTRVPLEYKFHEIQLKSDQLVISDHNIKELGKLTTSESESEQNLKQSSQVYREYHQYLIDSARKTSAILDRPLSNKNFLEALKDLENANTPQFAIDRFSRSIWATILAEIQKY